MLPNRRPGDVFETMNPITGERGSISISYHPESGHICEIFFTGRDKDGTELEVRQRAAGIVASKVLQGEPIPEEFNEWVENERQSV